MAGHTAHWNYDDEDNECGPCNWAGDSQGKAQSPVDLQLAKMKSVCLTDHLKFVNYNKAINGEIVNNGHSIQFIPDPKIDVPEIYGGMLDQSYRFVQYHFHWAQSDNEGSEHTLGGLQYPAELHLVHKGVEDPNKLAVLGIFLNVGKDDSALRSEETVISKILEPGQRAEMKNQVLELKLPENRNSFARYNGSLTTPPCTECVIWTVFTEPVSITREQMALLRTIKDSTGNTLKKNYRQVQNLNNRTVYLAC